MRNDARLRAAFASFADTWLSFGFVPPASWLTRRSLDGPNPLRFPPGTLKFELYAFV